MKVIDAPFYGTGKFSYLCTNCGKKFYTIYNAEMHEKEPCINPNFKLYLINQAKDRARARMNHTLNPQLFFQSHFMEELIKVTVDQCLEACFYNGMAQPDYETRLQVASDIEEKFKTILEK